VIRAAIRRLVFALVAILLMRRAFVSTALVSFVVACGPIASPSPPPTLAAVCTTEDGKKVSDKLNQFATEWDDTLKLASSTSRIALATPVSQLQRIRRDLQAQTWPDCAQTAKGLLVGSMDATIDGNLAFMAQKPDFVADADLKKGSELLASFSQEMLYLSGATRPAPTSTPPPLVGRTVRVRPATPEDGTDVIVAASAAVMTEFMNSRRAGTIDTDGLRKMASEGRLWRIDAATNVRVVTFQGTAADLVYQIEVLEGPSQGGQGWVAASSLP
jgi:hypothetical protein